MDYLPVEFQKKMKTLLKDEYEEFLSIYKAEPLQGLRVNTLKISTREFKNISPFSLEDIPWAREGFYYSLKDRPGKHPYHEVGLYYIQEPSAMAVGEVVDPKPGEKILDLCAAPGGKTTHIASKLNGQGFILANEIHPARARILTQNTERMGIKNAVVTNESPDRLAKRFLGYFDKVLVDAPCSGEGMFRKNHEACSQWSLENVALCANRQLDILSHAKDMLRPGGRLIYSTCTFSPEENEEVIDKFLKLNPSFKLADIEPYLGFDSGIIDNTIRIWPHKVRGEGHFIAVLEKVDGVEHKKARYAKGVTNPKSLKEYFEFAKEFLLDTPKGKYVLFGDHLYIAPEEMLSFDRLKVMAPGWYIGTFKKNRFEPSHALALSLNRHQVRFSLNLDANSSDIAAYLRGETLDIEDAKGKGWHLVEVDKYSIGWGKLSNNMLKNHFPKYLRWNS